MLDVIHQNVSKNWKKIWDPGFWNTELENTLSNPNKLQPHQIALSSVANAPKIKEGIPVHPTVFYKSLAFPFFAIPNHFLSL